MNLGKDLNYLRLESGLGVRELGHLTGIPFSYIAAFERGRMNPNLDEIKKLLKALDYDRGKGLESVEHRAVDKAVTKGRS